MLGSDPTEAADQGVGGTIVAEGRFRLRFQFAQDSAGEHFAELNSPLIKGVDVPNHSLSEDFVFVKGNERTERAGSQRIGQQRVGRAIALEGFIGNERFGGRLGADFVRCFAEGQRFGLSDEICEKGGMMAGGQGVGVGSGKTDEIGGDKNGSLMEELEESVLAVGAGFSPEYRAGGPSNGATVAVGGFSVAFHVCLLQISGEAGQILAVRKDGMGLRAEKVDIPDSQESH